MIAVLTGADARRAQRQLRHPRMTSHLTAHKIQNPMLFCFSTSHMCINHTLSGTISDFISDAYIFNSRVIKTMSTVRAAHLLIKQTGSRNPVSRRTNQTITTSPELAHEELLQFEAAILQQVNEEGVDLGTIFREYASERSDCSSFQQGGDLGEFTRGQMQQPFEDATFALQPGQMSSIVSTDSGYHLIYRIS